MGEDQGRGASRLQCSRLKNEETLGWNFEGNVRRSRLSLVKKNERRGGRSRNQITKDYTGFRIKIGGAPTIKNL